MLRFVLTLIGDLICIVFTVILGAFITAAFAWITAYMISPDAALIGAMTGIYMSYMMMKDYFPPKFSRETMFSFGAPSKDNLSNKSQS